MAWDNETHRAITLARLKVSPPETVYRELQQYADHFRGDQFVSRITFGAADKELELALLARNDPLINLGLARYGTSLTVVSTLYKRAQAGSEDSNFDRAIRLASLSNRNLPSFLNPKSFGAIDLTELRRLIREGDEDEISVMMGNSETCRLLPQLYQRRPPFDELPPERLRELVLASLANVWIILADNISDLAWDIYRDAYRLLQMAPVEINWAYTLYQLLIEIDPYRAITPKDNPQTDPHTLIRRWSDLKIEDARGWATSLTFVDEFQCLIAALYGKQFDKSIGQKYETVKPIGSADDPEVALRCAYYGNGALTVDQMRKGYERDQEVFVFVALLNDNLYIEHECRVELEEQISKWVVFARRYVRRCEQIHRRDRSFDPRPISRSGAMFLDDGVAKKPTDEITSLARIETQLAALGKRMERVSQMTVLGFLILLVVFIFARH